MITMFYHSGNNSFFIMVVKNNAELLFNTTDSLIEILFHKSKKITNNFVNNVIITMGLIGHELQVW